MTKNNFQKKAIREQMNRTGQSYSVAKRSVEGTLSSPSMPFPGKELENFTGGFQNESLNLFAVGKHVNSKHLASTLASHLTTQGRKPFQFSLGHEIKPANLFFSLSELAQTSSGNLTQGDVFIIDATGLSVKNFEPNSSSVNNFKKFIITQGICVILLINSPFSELASRENYLYQGMNSDLSMTCDTISFLRETEEKAARFDIVKNRYGALREVKSSLQTHSPVSQ